MWSLIKAECDYNKYTLLMLASLIPLFCVIEAATSFYDANILIVIAAYFMAYIAGFRIIREKRESNYILLPLSIRQTAFSRILIILLPFMYALAVYISGHHIFNPDGNVQYKPVTAISGLYILGFTVFIIMRDIFRNPVKNPGKESFGKIAVLFGLFILFLGMVTVSLVLYGSYGTGVTPPGYLAAFGKVLVVIFGFIFSYTGIILLYLLSLFLCYLSTISFIGRKSYV